MGRLASLITIMVVIDILFIITGQPTLDSASSLIIETINDPKSLQELNLWSVIVIGVSSLAVFATVVVGFVSRSSDILIFIPIGIVLIGLVSDYLAIFNYLWSINVVFATLLIVPFMISYIISGLEWIRGKD